MMYHTQKLEAYARGALTRAGVSADVVLVPSCRAVLAAHGQVVFTEADTVSSYELQLFVPRRHFWCIGALTDPYWWSLTVLVWHEVAHVLTLQSGQGAKAAHGKRWREALFEIATRETGVPVHFDYAPPEGIDRAIVDRLRDAGAKSPLWGPP